MATEACRGCLRRSWLLSELGVVLDYRGRDPGRLFALLSLADQTLIDAVAGRRRAEVRERWERFEVDELPAAAGVRTTCGHRENSAVGLGRVALAPRALHFSGGDERLRSLARQPAVAIVGSGRASDYGMEVARSLARGLAASGVTVVSGFGEGIAAAVHDGTLAGRGRPMATTAGGVDVCRPSHRRALYERVHREGCLVGELPCGFRQRRWCGLASTRVVAALAAVTVVVEANASERELAPARAARTFGATVAAVPGRVTTRTAQGTCGLLMEGAPLVRDAGDVLDLLHDARATGDERRHGTARPPAKRTGGQARLEPRLGELLERVGAGRDTLGRLTGEGADAQETMLGLSELELMGLLGRGDGGRYVVRERLADERQG
ncbi:MAG TPA: DNA-processing protein DprA [Solirubrobacteraceae bacterium]|nr:DNA-processing protein DprA [Solirubrobacteraceae bacterium]